MQTLADTFKAISKKKEFVGKICKLVLRIQDPTLNKKFEVLKNFNFLQQLKCYREFELGNERGEKDLDDFINIMKQTDVTKPKSPLISNPPKVKFSIFNNQNLFLFREEFYQSRFSLNFRLKRTDINKHLVPPTKLIPIKMNLITLN